MASITLTTLWLTDAADLTDSVSFPMLSKLTVTPSAAGEVRRYANGRLRAVNKPGRAQQAEITLPACDRSQVDWIEAHVAVPVLVRSKDGRKFYGVYYAPTLDEHGYEDAADVTLTVTLISFSEAV